jgi:hypothetical protein
MAGVTNKRPKVVLVKKDSVDQAGVFLDSLPDKPREDFSLRAAVDRLREPIRAALSKGYTYEEVAELLADQGIKISPSTLKNYVPSGTRQSSKDKSASNGRKTKKSDDETLSLTDEPPAELEPTSSLEPEVAPEEEEEEETPAPAKRRTKSTAAKSKNEASTSAKPAAKTRSSSKPAGKAATGAKSRSRTTSKK